MNSADNLLTKSILNRARVLSAWTDTAENLKELKD